MAFDVSGLSGLSASRNQAVYSYETADTLADVLAAGYFNSLAARLRANDRLQIEAADQSAELRVVSAGDAVRVVEAGAPARPYGARRTLGLLGDSISAQNTGVSPALVRSIGYGTWASIFLGQAVQLTPPYNKGIAGENTAQILARVGSVIEAGPDICAVMAGTNDNAGGITPAGTMANLQAIYEALNRAGILVVALPILPREATGYSSTQSVEDSRKRQTASINRWIEIYCRQHPGVIFADPRPYWTDGSTGAAKAGYTYDKLHPNPTGAFWVGKAVATALAPVVQPTNRLFTDAGDTCHATENPTGNLLTNGLLTGTTGTVNAGNSGQVATGWTMSRLSGSLTSAVSKVSRADGIGAWQQIALTDAGTGGTSEQFMLFQTISYTGGQYAAGDVLELTAEVDVSADARLGACYLRLADDDGTGVEVQAGALDTFDNSNLFPNAAWTGVLTAPPLTVRPISVAGSAKLICRLVVLVNATAAAAVSVRFGRVSLRKV